MKRKEIDVETWHKIISRNCDKGKHRFRINGYGVCWCVICGQLSNTSNAQTLSDEDSLTIKMITNESTD